MADIESFVSVFRLDERKTKRSRGEYWIFSPLRNEKESSVKITQCSNGTICMKDFGSPTNNNAETLAAVGKDLSWFHVGEIDNRPKQEAWIAYIEGKVGKKMVAYYQYLDKNGDYLYTKVRFEGKDFRFGILKDGRFSFGLSGQDRKSLGGFFCSDFNGFQKAVADGQAVYYVEGEKDVITLKKYGYMAISCGGSGDWNSSVAEVFRGASKIIIFQDNDPAGAKLSKQVYRDLLKICDDLQIVKPCVEIKGGDISDLEELHGAKAVHRVARFDKYQFHLCNVKEDKKTGEITRKITGVYDYEIFKYISETRSILVIGGVVYMYENGVFVPDMAGAKLKTAIRELIFPQYVKSNTIKRVFDLFLGAEELQAKPQDLNQYPDRWVNFRNGFYDPVGRKMIPHDPKYRAVNMLPHEYYPNSRPKGETIESWLNSVMAPDDKEMMLQYAGYCCTRDITQQVYMIINGVGATGKSTLINLIQAVIGEDNTVALPLEDLTQRFAAYDLMWKQLNACADLRIDILDDGSMIKKLSGEDAVKGEAKGKQAIYFKSYARLLFSTNALPTIKEERTDGFYRRLLILTMNKKPQKQDALFLEKLEKEIDYFIHLCMDALGRLYDSGSITRSKLSVKAVRQLRADSDVTEAFLSAKTVQDKDGKILRSELYEEFKKFCEKAERQTLKKSNFFRAMRSKGISEIKTSGNWFFWGISWNNENSPDEFLQASEDDLKELGYF